MFIEEGIEYNVGDRQEKDKKTRVIYGSLTIYVIFHTSVLLWKHEENRKTPRKDDLVCPALKEQLWLPGKHLFSDFKQNKTVP